MLKRALRSLLYHWKKNVCALCAYTVLFALCFGSIVLFSSVWGQREFLRASLERSVTLRAASYRIRVNETQAGVLSFPLDLHAATTSISPSSSTPPRRSGRPGP